MDKIIVLVLLLLCTCTFKPFNVINVQSQPYTAGRKESGSGVNYRVKVVVYKPSSKLRFNGLSNGVKSCSIKLMNSHGDFIRNFSKSDTLFLLSTIIFSSGEKAGCPDTTMYLKYLYKNRSDSIKLKPTPASTKTYF